MTYDTGNSECSSFEHYTTESISCKSNISHFSRTKERVFKLNKNASIPWKPKLFEKQKFDNKRKTYFGIRKCYRCVDLPHKADKCTFGEIQK